MKETFHGDGHEHFISDLKGGFEGIETKAAGKAPQTPTDTFDMMLTTVLRHQRVPQGLEDVSKVPKLVAELLRRGWSDEDVKAALGENLLRVLRRAEEVNTQTDLFPQRGGVDCDESLTPLFCYE